MDDIKAMHLHNPLKDSPKDGRGLFFWKEGLGERLIIVWVQAGISSEWVIVEKGLLVLSDQRNYLLLPKLLIG